MTRRGCSPLRDGRKQCILSSFFVSYTLTGPILSLSLPFLINYTCSSPFPSSHAWPFHFSQKKCYGRPPTGSVPLHTCISPDVFYSSKSLSVCLSLFIFLSLCLYHPLCLFVSFFCPLPPFLSSPSQSLCLCFSLRLSLSAHKSPEKTGIHFHGTVHILAQRLPPSLFMAFQTSDILCFYDKSICSGFLSSLNWPFLLLLLLLPRTSTFLLLTPFSSLQT